MSQPRKAGPVCAEEPPRSLSEWHELNVAVRFATHDVGARCPSWWREKPAPSRQLFSRQALVLVLRAKPSIHRKARVHAVTFA